MNVGGRWICLTLYRLTEHRSVTRECPCFDVSRTVEFVECSFQAMKRRFGREDCT